MVGVHIDAALLYQLNNREKWLRSLGASWWAVLQKVQLGHDTWPEHLQDLEEKEDGKEAEEENVFLDLGDDRESDSGAQELEPEDTELDDYLAEYILQSQMAGEGEEDGDNGGYLGDY